MKITLTETALAQIMKVCSPHVSKQWYKPSFDYIHIGLVDNVATAVSTDGYKIAQTVVSATGDVGDYVIPVVKLPKKYGACTIENTDTTITFDFFTSKIVEQKLEGVEPFGDITKFLPKSECKVRRAFNRTFMGDVLKSFDTKNLTFELHSTVEGMVVSGDVGTVMILPVRLENSL